MKSIFLSCSTLCLLRPASNHLSHLSPLFPKIPLFPASSPFPLFPSFPLVGFTPLQSFPLDPLKPVTLLLLFPLFSGGSEVSKTFATGSEISWLLSFSRRLSRASQIASLLNVSGSFFPPEMFTVLFRVSRYSRSFASSLRFS